MELGARKLKILQAVIEAYIQTGEPVGSKALCELLDVSVSSATIRNEMASLSELGLLEQPHTSAGRIPTQFGYRLYINELMRPKPLSDEEMRYIDGYLSEYADDPDLLLEKAAEMLAEMTKYAAISTTPTNRDATIQRIQLVQTGPHTAMLVLTTSTGAVKSKLFRTNYLLNSDILRMFSNVLNEKMGSVHLLNVTPDFIKSTAFSIGELSLMMAPCLWPWARRAGMGSKDQRAAGGPHQPAVSAGVRGGQREAAASFFGTARRAGEAGRSPKGKAGGADRWGKQPAGDDRHQCGAGLVLYGPADPGNPGRNRSHPDGLSQDCFQSAVSGPVCGRYAQRDYGRRRLAAL